MSNEVKLACAGDAETFVASSSGTWIALPAAEFEAWRRVVEAARHWGQHNDGWVINNANLLPPSKRLKAAVDALLRDQPPGPVGAKEGE